MASDGETGPLAGIELAIEGLYESVTPNAPVDLYGGDLVLKWEGNEVRAPGAIQLVWEPFPRLTFTCEVPLEEAFDGLLSPGDLPLHVLVEMPDHVGKGDGAVLGSTITFAGATSQTLLRGSTWDFLRGDPAPTESVLFHVSNFPNYVGTNVGSVGAVWSGRLTAQSEEWRIELDAVGHRTELWSELSARGGYAITHVGRITRPDGKTIDFGDLEKLRTTIYRWLTLIRGERSEPFMFAGMHDGEVIWELWSAPNVAPWTAWRSWLPRILVAPIPGPGETMVDLSPILASLFRLQPDPELSRVVERAINWYSQCVEPAYSPTTVVLAQAGLELMSWLRLVEEVGLSEESFEHLNAADALRISLDHARIPLAVPPEAPDLHAATRSQGSLRELDGPGAVVELRNGTIHPRARRRLADPTAELQGSLLAARYLELLLLHRLGYAGMTNNRVEWGSEAAGVPPRPVWVPWVKPTARELQG